MGVLDSVNALIAGLTWAREVAQRVHDAELQEAIADATLKAAELKGELAALRDENQKLRDRLSGKDSLRDKVRFDDRGFYVPTVQIKGYGQGAFCPACLDATEKLITLKRAHRIKVKQSGRGYKRVRRADGYECPICNTHYPEHV